MARDLATLGHRRFRQGYPLNVRRREEVRRSLAEAAEELAWDEVVALSDDPVAVVAKDVKKILRSGVRSLEKSLEEELEQKKKETRRLEKVITQVEALAEDPEAFPAEIEYVHTARKVDSGFPTKVETLTLTDPEGGQEDPQVAAALGQVSQGSGGRAQAATGHPRRDGKRPLGRDRRLA